jgi:hypothetical protein
VLDDDGFPTCWGEIPTPDLAEGLSFVGLSAAQGACGWTVDGKVYCWAETDEILQDIAPPTEIAASPP